MFLFDCRKIEKYIVGDHRLEELFARYFPKSYREWHQTYVSYEPVNLFRKYFDENYESFTTLFLTVFGTHVNLIKALKEYANLNSFFRKEGVEIVHEPNLDPEAFRGLMNSSFKEISYFKDNPTAKTSLWHMLSVAIPYEFKNKDKCDINNLICSGSCTEDHKDHLGNSLGTTSDEGQFYFYRNALLGSKGALEGLDKLCKSLKHMLS